MLKLSTKVNQVFWGKNLENENFMAAAIHCENWYFKKTNIFHYFPSKNLKYSQIFLSETIHAQENGSRGPHFAKSLNSNFLKGLTYSALVLRKLPTCFCSWLVYACKKVGNDMRISEVVHTQVGGCLISFNLQLSCVRILEVVWQTVHALRNDNHDYHDLITHSALGRGKVKSY